MISDVLYYQEFNDKGWLIYIKLYMKSDRLDIYIKIYLTSDGLYIPRFILQSDGLYISRFI